MKTVSTVMFIMLVLNTFSRQCSSDFLDARRNGAKANIRLCVVDDERASVPAVSVRVFMGMNFRERGYWLEGTTDTNGMFIIDGKTTGNEVEVYLSKQGFYDSFKKLCFITMGNEREAKDGKWEPYGEELVMPLRLIKNPVKLCSVPIRSYKFTDVICDWVGYDLEKNDFVKPHGEGCVSDFEVYLDWDRVYSLDSRQIGFKIRFVEPCSGYYLVPIEDVSKFTTPYNAVTNALFFQQASFYDKYNGVRLGNTFDGSKCWIVRSRCKINENGQLISANYSVVRFLGISGSRELKAGFGFLGAFNPTPNDTNLEDADSVRESCLRYKQKLEFGRQHKANVK